MDKKLLSLDPFTGLMTFHSYDEQTGNSIISYEADSTSVIEENKLFQNDPEISKAGIKNGFWRYASIPVGVQLQWLINDGIDVYKPEHGARISQKLEDPQYRYLKTTTKHHRFK